MNANIETELEEIVLMLSEHDTTDCANGELGVTKTEARVEQQWSSRNEVLASVGPWLATILSAYAVGITSSTVADLTETGALTEAQANWFASLHYAGAAVGCCVSSVIADAWGRKLSMMLGAVSSALGLMFILANVHYSLVLFGRFFCGLQFGLRSAVAAMYQVETASESVRGTVGFICGAAYSAGLMLGFGARLLLPWRWLMVAGITEALLGITVTSFLPESPRWYAMCDRLSEAKTSLTWLRMNNDPVVERELKDILESLRNSRSVTKLSSLLQDKRLMKPMLLAVVLMLALPCSGIPAVLMFIWQVERAVGIGNEALSTTALGMYQLALVFIIAPFMNRIGRRFFLGLGGSMISIALFTLCTCDYLRQEQLQLSRDEEEASSYWLVPYVSFGSILLLLTGHCTSWSALSFLVMGEILPTRIRGLGSGLSMLLSQIATLATCQTFIPAVKLIHLYGVFLLYAMLNSLMTFLVVRYVPETRCKTLEEIQRSFDLH